MPISFVPQQYRTADPYGYVASRTVNFRGRALSETGRGVINGGGQVSGQGTSKLGVSTGIFGKDFVIIELYQDSTAQAGLSWEYDVSSIPDDAYYVVLDYNYELSGDYENPPVASLELIDISEWDSTAQVFLGYIEITSGIITSIEEYDPLQPSRKREYFALWETHKNSNGTDHSFIDQDLTTNAHPTFNKITLTGSATSDTDAVTKLYVDNAIAGLDWQESILERRDSEPDSTGIYVGARYMVIDSPWGGASVNDLVEYDGTSWDSLTPDEGTSVWVGNEDKAYVFSNGTWILFASYITHNSLTGLQGGQVDEYYHLTSIQYTDLTDSGDSVLHYHSSDRNLVNATGTLSVAHGGTGQSTFTSYALLYGNGVSSIQQVGLGAIDLPLVSNGIAAPPSWKILPVPGGGTGTSNGSITGTGDLVFTSAIAVGGPSVLHLNKNGSIYFESLAIGIGTTNPQYPLHIGQNVIATPALFVETECDSVAPLVYFHVDNTNSSGPALQIRQDGTGDYIRFINEFGPVLIVDNSGEIDTLGRCFKINGNEILCETELGPTVVNSSLTKVGTISSGIWHGQTVLVDYGGTGATTFALDHLLLGDVTNPIKTMGGLRADTTSLNLPSIGLSIDDSLVIDKDRNWVGNPITGTNLLWQDSVEGRVYLEPGSPADEARYIALTAWGIGSNNDIATYHTGTGWTWDTPLEGTAVWVKDEDFIYVFDGTNWNKFQGEGGGTVESYWQTFNDGYLDGGDSITIFHSLDVQYPHVIVYDSTNQVVGPTYIRYINSNNIQLNFTGSRPISGTYAVRIGTGAGDESSVPASYTSAFTDLQLDSTACISIQHDLDVMFPVVQVFDGNNMLVIPHAVYYIDRNTVKLCFSGGTPIVGLYHVRVIGGTVSATEGQPYKCAFTNDELTSDKITITHGLGTTYPITTVYDGNDKIIFPNEVTYIDTESIQLDFTGATPLVGTYHVIVAGSVGQSLKIDMSNLEPGTIPTFIEAHIGISGEFVSIDYGNYVLYDDSTSSIELGDVTVHDGFILDYKLSGNSKKEIGRLYIIADITDASMSIQNIDLGTPVGVTFDTYVSGGQVYLESVTSGVGGTSILKIKITKFLV
jgi:hypothetical protein